MIPSQITSSGLAQRAVRTLYPYGAVRTVRRGPLKGFRVVVSPSMGVSFIWKLGDAAEWTWVRWVHPHSCVYDVGANNGQSTLHLAHAVGSAGRVIAFEPMPEAFATLSRNIEINALHQVTPIAAAVAATRGVGRMQTDPRLLGQGRLVALPSLGGTTLEVDYVMLDDYQAMNWPAPDFIKIDTEGAGGFVLEGAQRLIATLRPPIYIEMHDQLEHDGVADLVAKHDYVAHDMRGKLIAEPRTAYYCGALLCRPRERAGAFS